MNISFPSSRQPLRFGLLASAAAIVVATAAALLAPKARASDADLAAKVQAAFPNTKIGSVSCGVALGLCEVTAGKTVFYVSRDAHFAVVGSLLDLHNRVDLTDRRIKELTALDAVTAGIGGAAPAVAAEPVQAAASARPAASPALGVLKIDLPKSNAIVHHAGAALKMSVISDLNCSYCKMLFEELKSAPDIEVTEYPVQLLRPDSLDKAKLALCAHDREATSNAIYFGGDVKVAGDCKAALAAVQANTAYAHGHGVSGTPTLVRADGQASAGYMPIDQLRAWLKASAA